MKLYGVQYGAIPFAGIDSFNRYIIRQSINDEYAAHLNAPSTTFTFGGLVWEAGIIGAREFAGHFLTVDVAAGHDTEVGSAPEIPYGVIQNETKSQYRQIGLTGDCKVKLPFRP